MNNCVNSEAYTLARTKQEVFKVLDEYSCNGAEQELFSGGTGDLEKRFISALNNAVRLVYLSSARRPLRARVSLALPTESLRCVCCDICDGEQKSFEVSKAYAISFLYCGEGKVDIISDSGTSESELKSQYGVFSCFKSCIFENTSMIKFSSQKHLQIKCLYLYGKQHKDCESKFIPDGERLFCEFSSRCIELARATKIDGQRKTEVPCDIFEFSDGALSCDKRYSGEYIIDYYEYPEQLTETDPPSKLIPLPPAACAAAVYATAAELCEREDGELYSRLFYKYRELLANIYPAESLKRKNRFFGGLFGKSRSKGVFWG